MFLITIGMSLDLGVIVARWPLFLAALVGVILAKVAVTALLLRIASGRWAVAAEASLLMRSCAPITPT